MHKGFYHLHRRKRVTNKLEPFPSPAKWKKWFDGLVYFIAFSGPLAMLPQVWKIFISMTAASISLFYWIFFFIGSFIWLGYGIIHKEKPIIFANAIYLVLSLLIIVGAVIYR